MTRRSLLATLTGFFAAPFVTKAKSLEKPFRYHIVRVYGSPDADGWRAINRFILNRFPLGIGRGEFHTLAMSEALPIQSITREKWSAVLITLRSDRCQHNNCAWDLEHPCCPVESYTEIAPLSRKPLDPPARINVTVIGEPSFESKRQIAQWIRDEERS